MVLEWASTIFKLPMNKKGVEQMVNTKAARFGQPAQIF
jgi:hypothetical protein